MPTSENFNDDFFAQLVFEPPSFLALPQGHLKLEVFKKLNPKTILNSLKLKTNGFFSINFLHFYVMNYILKNLDCLVLPLQMQTLLQRQMSSGPAGPKIQN